MLHQLTSVFHTCLSTWEVYHASKQQQLAYIRSLATQVVEECTLIDTNNDVAETDDHVYNYARVLCHYGVMQRLVMKINYDGDSHQNS